MEGNCYARLAGAVLRAGVAIPEQLSIVGYDDSPAARTFVHLTTVKQDAANLATVNAVVQRIDEGRTDSRQGRRHPAVGHT